jgi:hypothetical protein
MSRAGITAEAASWIVGSSGTTTGEIEERILKAAQPTWPRVVAYVGRELGDSGRAEVEALALEIWEDTLSDVAQLMQRKRHENEIHDLESYLYKAFVHLFINAATSERTFNEKLEFHPFAETLAILKGTEDFDSVKRLEQKILAKEVLRLADQLTVEVAYRLSSRGSWADIARDMGMTTPQLKMPYRYRIEKLRKQVLGASNQISIPEQNP